jgi:protoporphyrinogen oxidase
MTESRYDAVVLGGGMAGLGAADRLHGAGKRVLLVEAAPTVGGLARAITVGGEPIEPYYHHIFPQDHETRELIDQLGMGDRLEWRHAPMAVMHDGHAVPFDSPLDVLRFPAVSLPQRVRLGAASAYQLVRRDRNRMDTTSVGVEGPRWFGEPAYRMLWQPLLTAKFGEAADDIAMAWLVARIRQRAGGRKAGGDKLGYLGGSLGSLASAFADDVAARGVEMRTGTKATGLERTPDGWIVRIEKDGQLDELHAAVVVACLSGPILSRLVELPPAYKTAIDSIAYRGIVCALLELDRPLSPYYWTNVTDKLGLGCVGIIEHTNFIPAERYGGRSLLYLAHYVDRAGPTWTATADELIDAVEPALMALNAAYSRDWVKDVHLNRDPFAQPVPLAGGPMPTLDIETGLPGLIHASLAHVYPDDRGVSKALGLGRRAADRVLGRMATDAPHLDPAAAVRLAAPGSAPR